MTNRFAIVIILYSMICTSYSQINLSFDKNCIEKNSAILSIALIESAGIENISTLLDNNISLLTFWDVDSLGSVMKLIKITSKEDVPFNLKDRLTDYLTNNNIHFLICFEKPPGLNKCDAYNTISKDLFDENKRFVMINVPFPGDLMFSYNIEEEKAMEQGQLLTKIEYLQKMIFQYSKN